MKTPAKTIKDIADKNKSSASKKQNKSLLKVSSDSVYKSYDEAVDAAKKRGPQPIQIMPHKNGWVLSKSKKFFPKGPVKTPSGSPM